MLENSIAYVIKHSLEILNILVAVLVVREAIKMRRISTQSELVFSLKNKGTVGIRGRIENVGSSVAYNIEVDCDKELKLYNRVDIKDAFEPLSYLAPKGYFEIGYGFVNIEGDIVGTGEMNHNIIISWTRTKSKNSKLFKASFPVDMKYFYASPNYEGYTKIVEAIDDIKDELKDIGRKIK